MKQNPIGWRTALAILTALAIIVSSQAVTALGIPDPQPDSQMPNVFYGATNPSALRKGPVLVFVHGLGGTANNWWVGNNTYTLAYNMGYRTAFVSTSPDNSPNSKDIQTNAAVLKLALPGIASHFNTPKLYLIGHSKGALDLQGAMQDASIRALVKAVFTISTPNQGTELADWAFAHPDIAGPLNLLTPAVDSLRTNNIATFRSQIDPLIQSSGIPFYTLSGDVFNSNPLTLVTGSILRSLVPGLYHDTFNDGFVTVARARLASKLSGDMGSLSTDHFNTDTGDVSLQRIAGRIHEIENSFNLFTPIAKDGFKDVSPLGDSSNTWAWSSKWFKGKLYVGTGREQNCVTYLTSDVRAGTSIYTPSMLLNQCPDRDTLAASLGAEIWRYTPETGQWERVFKSPDTIPIQFDGNGNPTKFTGRDMGFRSMEIFVESDGTQALYAGGVTSGGAYEVAPFQPNGYPPPRILRSTDGVNWAPLPQNPGTFFGEIGNLLLAPDVKVRSFRSLQSYKGMLFATAVDYIGNGIIIASSNPAAGDNAWQQVSPDRSQLPVWNLTVFNNFLYTTTGFTADQDATVPGYGLYKTDATGAPPYNFTPIVTNGAYQTDINLRAPNGMTFAEFQGQLYLGTNRPTELIRVNPDDSWDLVVGEPRNTPQGLKAPISGFGIGFGNWFTGHFWRMTTHGGRLYLGTWDWSASLLDYSQLASLNDTFGAQQGFDLWRTNDGSHWTAVTRGGLGDPRNWGVRVLESTPVGLFLGTTRQKYGLHVFRSVEPPPLPAVVPPRIDAASVSISGPNAFVTWSQVPGAVKYNVYRAKLVALNLQPPPSAPPQTPAPAAVFPQTYGLIASTTSLFFAEKASVDIQNLYYVRAEDANGNLSPPSNTVAAPSKASP